MNALTLKLKTQHAIWKQVNIYGDVSLEQTYSEIKKGGGFYSVRARLFFQTKEPIIPSCGVATSILRLVRLTINEMGFREPASLEEIAAQSASQGLFHFTPKGTLQIINKHVTPVEGEKFAFLTKVHQEITLITLELDAYGNKRIDVRESEKSFPVRGNPYTYIFCI